jgi:hypothetical protein
MLRMPPRPPTWPRRCSRSKRIADPKAEPAGSAFFCWVIMPMRNLALVAAVLLLGAASLRADPDDREEPAGGAAGILVDPSGEHWGLSIESDMWLRGTPVFADYFGRLIWNDVEEDWYAAAGLSLRLMPHWSVAPFVGSGGSYNQAMSASSEQDTETEDAEPADRAESYWSGHVESGIRFWLPSRYHMLEFIGSYNWTSLEGEDRDYWLVGIVLGVDP